MYTGWKPDTYHDHAEQGVELPDTPAPRYYFAVNPLMITIYTAFLSTTNLNALPTRCIRILYTILKAIPSANSIIRPVFLTETKCVLCKVGSEFLLSGTFF